MSAKPPLPPYYPTARADGQGIDPEHIAEIVDANFALDPHVRSWLLGSALDLEAEDFVTLVAYVALLQAPAHEHLRCQRAGDGRLHWVALKTKKQKRGGRHSRRRAGR